MKQMKMLLLNTAAAVVLLFTLPILSEPSAAQTTITICNGSGYKCIATYTQDGVEYTVESESEHEGGDMVIES